MVEGVPVSGDPWEGSRTPQKNSISDSLIHTQNSVIMEVLLIQANSAD